MATATTTRTRKTPPNRTDGPVETALDAVAQAIQAVEALELTRRLEGCTDTPLGYTWEGIYELMRSRDPHLVRAFFTLYADSIIAASPRPPEIDIEAVIDEVVAEFWWGNNDGCAVCDCCGWLVTDCQCGSSAVSGVAASA